MTATTDRPGHTSDGALELDDLQGVLVRGYGNLPAAVFLGLAVTQPSDARAWLASTLPSVTTGAQRPSDRACNLAFGARALRLLGLPEPTLDGFSLPFREGMATAHRSRLLGDVGPDAPEHWEWGGSGREVDVLVMLYGESPDRLRPVVDALAAEASTRGLAEVLRVNSDELGETEHFGFRDGLSQPVLPSLGKDGPEAETVRDGEFVLGYRNEYGHVTERPLVAVASDPEGLLPGDVTGSGLRDFGRNGSYLAVRQLRQDVRAFWHFVRSTVDEHPEDQVRLAAKLVGRWPSGASLVLTPDREDPALAAENGFGYHHPDADGTSCPIGSHVRRAHPRDSLDPRPGSAASIEVGKRHRLLRRGRPYGSFVPLPRLLEDPNAADDQPRGLMFACLNGNLSRQFEFVQHTWLGSRKFAGLYDDPDPLTSPRDGRVFTIQRHPVRQRLTGLPGFVQVRGGGYFFLPGMRALRFLSTDPTDR